MDTRGKNEEAGNGGRQQAITGVRRKRGIRSNRGRQDMGFFLKEETRKEDLAGKEKKLGHLSEVFCGKGFQGHVVCNVMFA